MEPPLISGQRLLYWIAWTCKLLRENADASPEDVGYLAGRKERVITRFENGTNWPGELEVIVAAYAEIAGLENSLAPWQIALDLWLEHGTLPMVDRRQEQARQRSDQERIVKQMRDQMTAWLAADHAGPAQMSTAKKTRRAAAE